MRGKYLKIATLALGISGAGLAGPALANGDDIYRAVQEQFKFAYGEICETGRDGQADGQYDGQAGALAEPQVINLKYASPFQKDGSLQNDFVLFIFPCFYGAYNFSSVFYRFDMANDGISQLHFAVPEYEFEYLDASNERTGPIRLTGFGTSNVLTNPYFDEKTNSLNSFARWRGLADASSSGRWQFENGKFVLRSFDVDATYDGMINPVRIFGKGRPAPGEQD